MKDQFVIFIKTMILAAWTGLWALIGPVEQFVVATFILVIADFCTGIIASRVVRKEPLNSRKFGRTVLKMVLYTTAILLSRVMDTVYFIPKGISFDLVWVASGFISLTEFKSNMENISTVTGIDIWNRIEGYIPRLPKLPDNTNQSKP